MAFWRKTQRTLYRGAKISGDVNALARGRYPQHKAKQIITRTTMGRTTRTLKKLGMW